MVKGHLRGIMPSKAAHLLIYCFDDASENNKCRVSNSDLARCGWGGAWGRQYWMGTLSIPFALFWVQHCWFHLSLYIMYSDLFYKSELFNQLQPDLPPLQIYLPISTFSIFNGNCSVTISTALRPSQIVYVLHFPIDLLMLQLIRCK